jgi:hypothetical protein
MKKILVAAAILNLITALIHTIAGHFDLVLPFVQTDLEPALKAVLHACWHMVTAILFIFSGVLFYIGLKPVKVYAIPVINLLGGLYIIFALVFVLVGLSYHQFLFQVLFLLPIGIMSLYGANAIKRNANA